MTKYELRQIAVDFANGHIDFMDGFNEFPHAYEYKHKMMAGMYVSMNGLTDDDYKYISEMVPVFAGIKRQFIFEPKRKVICYCGSLRVAIDAFKKAEYQSVIDGNIALLPCCMFVDIQREYGAESDYKQKADDLHKRKIDICDEVFVLNVNGYIGDSTRSEIEYATSIRKPVFYLEPLISQTKP